MNTDDIDSGNESSADFATKLISNRIEEIVRQSNIEVSNKVNDGITNDSNYHDEDDDEDDNDLDDSALNITTITDNGKSANKKILKTKWLPEEVFCIALTMCCRFDVKVLCILG